MPLKARIKFVFVAVCSLFLSSCTVLDNPVSDSEYMLGTIIRITINDNRNDSAELIKNSFIIVDEIEKAASASMSDSELSYVNDNAFGQNIVLSDTLYDIIERSLYYCELSDGAFDIGIGALIDLWGIGTDSACVPDDNVLEALIGFHGYEHISLNGGDRSVRFDDERVRINLGACAKGYAEDKVRDYLTAQGVKDFLLDFGGSVSKGEGGYSFSVRSPDGGIACSVKALYASAVTSGDYERYFEQGGKRYHHILDASTGFPAESGIRGVTVNTDSAFVGDCLSTAVFVLGEEKGKELLSRFDCEYVIITDNITISDGLSQIGG